jgi:hypothetical protein
VRVWGALLGAAAQPAALPHTRSNQHAPACLPSPALRSYLNTFYPPDQVTAPYALIEAAVGVANVAGAPLAACLLMMDGVRGWHGWQW